jgi:hypothetical protein
VECAEDKNVTDYVPLSTRLGGPEALAQDAVVLAVQLVQWLRSDAFSRVAVT